MRRENVSLSLSYTCLLAFSYDIGVLLWFVVVVLTIFNCERCVTTQRKIYMCTRAFSLVSTKSRTYIKFY